MKRISFFLLFVAACAIMPLSARADDSATRVRIDDATMRKGYTVTHHNEDVKVAVMPDQIDQQVRVVIKNIDVDALPPLPQGTRLASDAFSYDIIGLESNPLIVKRPSNVAVRYTSDSAHTKALYNWDDTKDTWYRMPSSLDTENRYVRGSTVMPYSIVVALEDEVVQASWFSSSQALGAASNDYPIGTRLHVTNADTGAAVDVTVISTGPFDPRYTIDLTRDAFAALRDLFEGVVGVTIEEAHDVITTVDEPAIRSTTGAVLDAASGTFLWTDDANDVRSIASLTKLMTAQVTLDLDVDMDAEVIMQSSDQVPGARVDFRTGDHVRVRDLFMGTLVSSGNNAAKALARASGLSHDDFVAHMNELAMAYDMTDTTFVDPTGLDPANVSTAHDVALLSEEALKTLTMLIATTTKEYTTTILNTGRAVYFHTTSTLVRDGFDYRITGSKTGYLDEAGYCLMTKVHDNDRQIIAIVLGAPTSQARFDDTAQLLRWGMTQQP